MAYTVDQTYTFEGLKTAKPTDDIMKVGNIYDPGNPGASPTHATVFYNRTDGKVYIDLTDANAAPVAPTN